MTAATDWSALERKLVFYLSFFSSVDWLRIVIRFTITKCKAAKKLEAQFTWLNSYLLFPFSLLCMVTSEEKKIERRNQDSAPCGKTDTGHWIHLTWSMAYNHINNHYTCILILIIFTFLRLLFIIFLVCSKDVEKNTKANEISTIFHFQFNSSSLQKNFYQVLACCLLSSGNWSIIKGFIIIIKQYNYH